MHYIGICDFPNGEQARKTAEFFQNLCIWNSLDCKLMVGVMMSYKTLMEESSKWGKVWPKKEDIAEIFIDHPVVFNTIHYADYEFNTSLWHLVKAVKFGGPRIQAIQLDMIWPPDVFLNGLKKNFPHLKIVLQINTKALEVVRYDPCVLVEWLKRYGDILNFVLFDKSHGRGLGMDANEPMPFLKEVRSSLPNLQTGVAGGLGPSTMGLIMPIVREFPNINIDAQGRLRSSGNAVDPVDWNMAHEYLRKAVKIFSS